MQVLESVFANAATPQKLVLVVLLAALLLTPILAFLAHSRDGLWRRLLSDLGVAGPLLGLLVGALNSFHMARTIQRLPFDVTAKQLAPGVLEVSTLIVMGTAVGLCAMAARLAADTTGRFRNA